ncbi:hypothetical protein ASZ78_003432 [Callipepla squamata]|uniref:U2A'/phosphoprotein 32 family A C-terminal domain-containing protein n=1 Tax=Callipepla squamata TaxID=9009 RepID=A0A226NMI6_CALSU|nr:hypothetical protein ASZ78_003432 [Callipepla squamata]
MVKLTAELIEQAAQYTNAVRDRELDLRGYKIPVIENLGATLDQFDAIDFSDNEIRKLDGFPLLRRLKTLLMNNNRICILRNPVTNKKHYRLYVIYKVPQVRVLDFQKVKLKERQEAEKMFKGKRGAQLAKDIARRSKTFNPGAGLPTDKKKAGPSPGDVEAIKTAIANASTLAEVERLKGLLQAGQIPGRERKPVGTVLSSYGWYILLACVAICLVVQKISQSLRMRPSGQHGAAGAAVEPDVVVRRQEALLASRLRMQEELNAQAERYKEKQRQLEEQKRMQKIEMWESMQKGKSYKGNLKLSQQEAEPGASTSSAVPRSKPNKKPLRGGGSDDSGERGEAEAGEAPFEEALQRGIENPEQHRLRVTPGERDQGNSSWK